MFWCMKWIFNLLFGMLVSFAIVTSFMNEEIMHELWWIGIVEANGVAYFGIYNAFRKIEKLEKEIKELKMKNDYEH